MKRAPCKRLKADETEKRKLIEELPGEKIKYGYRRIWALLRRQGVFISRKRMKRMLKEMSLQREAHFPKAQTATDREPDFRRSGCQVVYSYNIHRNNRLRQLLIHRNRGFMHEGYTRLGLPDVMWRIRSVCSCRGCSYEHIPFRKGGPSATQDRRRQPVHINGIQDGCCSE